ncbi:hypothetical protein JTB14_033015 [Gonioctena quinquepunctata]|nr:hypothetical protein JTB14_033015 [Gonioctena quinquepunctata]
MKISTVVLVQKVNKMADSVVLQESDSVNNANNLFMCCKNKPNFTYYVCIKCSCILHKSKCKECYSLLESAVDDGAHDMCTKNLHELTKDNDEKYKHISKLQLELKTFFDQSVDMESELIAMIKEKEQEIRNWNP